HGAIDVEKAARQREGVNLVRVDHLDRERDFRVRVQHDVLSHAVDILGDDWVVNELRVPVNFGGELAAESDLLVYRVEINLAFVDVPLADQLGVFFLTQRPLLCLRKSVGQAEYEKE